MKIRTKMLALFAAITVVGCAGHTHGVLAESSSEIKGGIFRHEGSEGTLMVLEYRGTRYEASGFAIEHSQNLTELRQRFGSGKHYDRIFSGLDTDHYVYSALVELRSNSASSLLCSAVWRAGGSPAGNCTTATGEKVSFQYR
nr:hypothetical protein [Rhodoferax sp.]